MPTLIPCDGDKIVMISPEGLEYPGTIEKRNSGLENDYSIKSSLSFSSRIYPGWRIRLEEEDQWFGDFLVFLTTDRSREE